MNILVTGATGLIGKSLTKALVKEGHTIRSTNRKVKNDKNNSVQPDEVVFFDLTADYVDFDEILMGIDVVVHLAALAHLLGKENESRKEMFEKTNLTGTHTLIKECVKRQVARFIFVSTVKVNGEYNAVSDKQEALPFKVDDIPRPSGSYALSKRAAEQAVIDACHDSDTEYVIIRPPLIYGPGVRANFFSLLSAVYKNIPLPLKSLRNQRSLLYVENLASAITVCVEHENVANKTYLLKDVDISIPELVDKIAFFMKKKSLLFYFPVSLLRFVGTVLGKKSSVERLTEPLIVDDSLFHRDTKWSMPYGSDEGLQRTALWFKGLREDKV